jgi:hypothetical protein
MVRLGRKYLGIMRFVRARDTVTLVAALSLLLSAGPAHALACLVDGGADNTPPRSEAPCHPPAHDEAPRYPDAPAPPGGPGPSGPTMSCCIAPAGVVRALERPAEAPVAVLAPRLAHALTSPTVVEARPRAHRPPAPPGPLHLLYGCFLN